MILMLIPPWALRANFHPLVSSRTAQLARSPTQDQNVSIKISMGYKQKIYGSITALCSSDQTFWLRNYILKYSNADSLVNSMIFLEEGISSIPKAR